MRSYTNSDPDAEISSTFVLSSRRVEAPLEEAAVAPREGDVVVFRGDAFHRVRRHTSPAAAGTTTSRISVVLEQYRIPGASRYNRTLRWERSYVRRV